MNPILAAIQAYLEKMVSGVAQVAADWLVNWFKQHVLPASGRLKAMAPEQLRAEARQWVHDMLAEFGNDLVAKKAIPVWLQGFIPTVETLVAQGIDKALDSAGL